jgi:hypothetical protein
MIYLAQISASSLLTQNGPAYHRTVLVLDMSIEGYLFRLLLISIILLAFSWAKNSISLSHSLVKKSNGSSHPLIMEMRGLEPLTSSVQGRRSPI